MTLHQISACFGIIRCLAWSYHFLALLGPFVRWKSSVGQFCCPLGFLLLFSKIWNCYNSRLV